MNKKWIARLLLSVSCGCGFSSGPETAAAASPETVKVKIKEKDGVIKVTFKAKEGGEKGDPTLLQAARVNQAFAEITKKYGNKVKVMAKVKNKAASQKDSNKKKRVIESAESGAFSNLPSLAGIRFKNIPVVQTKTVQNCSNLENLDIGGEGTRIEKNVVLNCPNLSAINIGGSNVRIEERAFEGTAVKKVNLGGAGLSVGPRAFSQCPRLSVVNIGGAGVGVGEEAFSASAVQTLKIGGCAISLGPRAFADCASLTSANLGGLNLHVDPTTFDGCSNLMTNEQMTPKE